MSVILHDRFTARLREAIDASGMSQSDLARKMGVNRQLLTLYLNGARCPGLDMLEKFATALEIDPLDLLQAEEICKTVA